MTQTKVLCVHFRPTNKTKSKILHFTTSPSEVLVFLSTTSDLFFSAKWFQRTWTLFWFLNYFFFVVFIECFIHLICCACVFMRNVYFQVMRTRKKKTKYKTRKAHIQLTVIIRSVARAHQTIKRKKEKKHCVCARSANVILFLRFWTGSDAIYTRFFLLLLFCGRCFFQTSNFYLSNLLTNECISENFHRCDDFANSFNQFRWKATAAAAGKRISLTD